VTRGGRAALRLAVACAGLAVAVQGARASDFSGTAELTAAQDEAIGASSSYLRQIYFLRYRRQFSQPISYRLSLRFQDDRGTNEFGPLQSRLRAQTLAPLAALDWRLERFGLSLLYDRNDARTLDESQRWNTSTIQRYGGRSYLRPSERTEWTFYADRLGFQGTQLDNVDDRVGVTYRFSSDAFRLAVEGRAQRYDDARAQRSRLGTGPRLNVQYSRSFRERYSVSAQYTADYFRTEQRTQLETSQVLATEEQPVAGLYVNEDLPIDTSANPMTPDPRLIDRAFDASTGISLGPDGASFHNIGLDMGRFVVLQELRVHVRNGAAAPVPFGGPVTWTVYSSQDGVRWSQVDGEGSSFEPEMSAYVIRFPATDARFFKVVNFGTNSVETLVTEVQSFVDELFQPSETLVAQNVQQGFGLIASARPLDRLVLGYTGRLNADGVSPYRAPWRWSTDVTNTVTATVGPFGAFTFGAGQLRTTAESPGRIQSTTTSSGSVRFQPIDRFDSTLEGRRTVDRVSAVSTISNGVSLANRLHVYDSARFLLSGGFTRQDITGGGSTDYLTGAGNAALRLRRDLDLQLNASLQRTISQTGDTSAQLAVPLFRIVTYEIYTAEASWRPTQQLALWLRLGYSVAALGEGLVQGYRAFWSPFPGGAIQLTVDYSEEIDPLSGRSYRRVAAAPRWTVNRHASLELSYNSIEGTGSVPVRQQNVFLTLTVML
jgi:hypothetical protein